MSGNNSPQIAVSAILNRFFIAPFIICKTNLTAGHCLNDGYPKMLNFLGVLLLILTIPGCCPKYPRFTVEIHHVIETWAFDYLNWVTARCLFETSDEFGCTHLRSTRKYQFPIR